MSSKFPWSPFPSSLEVLWSRFGICVESAVVSYPACSPSQVAHIPPSAHPVLAIPPAHPDPQPFHHRLGEGLDTVAKEVAIFFPPDYQPQQSVREWLCSVSLSDIIPALDVRIEEINMVDRMGLEGAPPFLM